MAAEKIQSTSASCNQYYLVASFTNFVLLKHQNHIPSLHTSYLHSNPRGKTEVDDLVLN